MKRRITILFFVIGLALVSMIGACVESFDLPVKKADVRFLVVDGFLNMAEGEVNIKLLRAGLINESNLPFEAGAVVSLEDAEGNLYLLTEQDSGRYQATALSSEPGKQYKVHIKTSNGKEYQSAFVTLKATPEIKELTWKAEADGTEIIVDTEDASGEARYYRWTFEETWEYHSRYTSWWRFTGIDVDTIELDNVAPRAPWEMVKVCYRTERSTKILTTTTAGLSTDIVNNFELQFLPQGTEKLGYRYSVLVKQVAISKDTYEYLEKLKKTSQDLGGLYAPQPSKVTGNVFSVTDPSEVVLGYFDVGQPVEKRVSIAREDLPAHLRQMDELSVFCKIDTVVIKYLDLLEASGDYTLLESFADKDGFPVAFTYSTNECADCRLRGGVTLKPDFWP